MPKQKNSLIFWPFSFVFWANISTGLGDPLGCSDLSQTFFGSSPTGIKWDKIVTEIIITTFVFLRHPRDPFTHILNTWHCWPCIWYVNASFNIILPYLYELSDVTIQKYAIYAKNAIKVSIFPLFFYFLTAWLVQRLLNSQIHKEHLALYDCVWLCMTIFWLYMTIYDYMWLCITM